MIFKSFLAKKTPRAFESKANFLGSNGIPIIALNLIVEFLLNLSKKFQGKKPSPIGCLCDESPKN